MKAIAILLGNYEELMRAQKDKEELNLPSASRVEPKSVEVEFYFRMDALTTMFLTLDGDIKCQIAGVTVLLKYEKKVHKAIANYLQTR